MTQIKNNQNIRITTLFKSIKYEWRKSVESLLLVGKYLHELKTLLPRKAFIENLSKQLSMSEMQAHRIENLYLHFRSKATVHVLSSKPSVLYLLASNVDPKRIDSLAGGGKVRIGNKMKKIDELTIKDIPQIGKPTAETMAFDVDEKDFDLKKATNAHRRLSTLIEELNDWASLLNIYEKRNIEITQKDLVKRYVQETILCLEKLAKQL